MQWIVTHYPISQLKYLVINENCCLTESYRNVKVCFTCYNLLIILSELEVNLTRTTLNYFQQQNFPLREHLLST